MEITTKQISKIFAVGKVLNMSKADIYLFIYGITFKDSLSDLTKQEAWKVIQAMNKIVVKSELSSNVIRLASKEQHLKLSELAHKINTHKELVNLDNMSNKMFGKKLALLKTDEAQKLIEALKSIIARKSV